MTDLLFKVVIGVVAGVLFLAALARLDDWQSRRRSR